MRTWILFKQTLLFTTNVIQLGKPFEPKVFSKFKFHTLSDLLNCCNYKVRQLMPVGYHVYHPVRTFVCKKKKKKIKSCNNWNFLIWITHVCIQGLKTYLEVFLFFRSKKYTFSIKHLVCSYENSWRQLKMLAYDNNWVDASTCRNMFFYICMHNIFAFIWIFLSKDVAKTNLWKEIALPRCERGCMVTWSLRRTLFRPVLTRTWLARQ